MFSTLVELHLSVLGLLPDGSKLLKYADDTQLFGAACVAQIRRELPVDDEINRPLVVR